MKHAGLPVMDVAAIEAFLDREFPEIRIHGDIYSVQGVSPLGATMRMAYHASQLRPGGTISGPAMMALSDLALYVAILGSIGPVGTRGDDQPLHQFPAQARRESNDCRLQASEAGQAAGGW